MARPRTVLDVEDMTNRQLVRELVRLTEELLTRLATCLDMGDEHEAALEEGIVLATRLDTIAADFLFGSDGARDYRRRMSERSTELVRAQRSDDAS